MPVLSKSSKPPFMAAYFSNVEFFPKAKTVKRVRLFLPEMSALRSLVCMYNATSSIPDRLFPAGQVGRFEAGNEKFSGAMPAVAGQALPAQLNIDLPVV